MYGMLFFYTNLFLLKFCSLYFNQRCTHFSFSFLVLDLQQLFDLCNKKNSATEEPGKATAGAQKDTEKQILMPTDYADLMVYVLLWQELVKFNNPVISVRFIYRLIFLSMFYTGWLPLLSLWKEQQ